MEQRQCLHSRSQNWKTSTKSISGHSSWSVPTVLITVASRLSDWREDTNLPKMYTSHPPSPRQFLSLFSIYSAQGLHQPISSPDPLWKRSFYLSTGWRITMTEFVAMSCARLYCVLLHCIRVQLWLYLSQGTFSGISAVIFENITLLYMDLSQVLQLKKKNNTNLPINVIIPKWKDAILNLPSFTSKHVPIRITQKHWKYKLWEKPSLIECNLFWWIWVKPILLTLFHQIAKSLLLLTVYFSSDGYVDKIHKLRLS